MTNEANILGSRTDETLEQHRQVHFYLDQLEVALDAMKEVASVEPMRRLAAQIEGLKERFASHHKAEENEGLFQAILEVLPQRRVEISRLIHEHAKMIEVLEMGRIHAQNGRPEDAAELCADLYTFLAQFRDHERREELLLEEAIRRESETIA